MEKLRDLNKDIQTNALLAEGKIAAIEVKLTMINNEKFNIKNKIETLKNNKNYDGQFK